MPDRMCIAPGCDRPVGRKGARGRCPRCYKRLQNQPGGLPPQRHNIDARYPAEAEMTAILTEVGSYTRLAARIGVSRWSLADYLAIRPELRDRLSEHHRVVHRSRLYPTPDVAYQATLQQNRVKARRRRNGGETGPAGSEMALAAEYAAILRGDPCSYCGRPTEHIDHVDPMVRGGDAGWENLTGACASCNTSKGRKPLLIFLLDSGPARAIRLHENGKRAIVSR